MSLQLPANTTYAAVAISALEDIQNDWSFPELDGHYLDDVELGSTRA